MKTILLLIFLVNLSFSVAQSNLDSLRIAYPKAISNKKLCQNILIQLEKNISNPVELAYLGAFQAVWANHTKNPLEKLNTFKKGKENLEKAIVLQADNIEIRFLRLSIQQNSPKILGYFRNLEEDENYILGHFAKIENQNLEVLIFNYFMNLNLSQKNQLKLKF